MANASFRTRVDTFWQWLSENEHRLYNELHGRSLDAEELASRIDAVAPSLAWELCPSPEEGREGFALSSEGNTSKRLLIEYMLSRAPELQRWTLFPAKQAQDDVSGVSVDIGTGTKFGFADFWFSVDFDTESELLAITVNHPQFSEIPKDARVQLTFLALDNALGEDLVETWVGAIEATPERTPGQKYGIDALRRQAHAALSLHDLDPNESPIDWCSYERIEPDDGGDGPRGDVFAGATCNIELVESFGDPEAEDDLAGTGASFAYVMLPVRGLAKGKELEQRNEAIDLLDSELKALGLGHTIGGAMGSEHAYVDLILFDEAQAIDRIREVMGSLEFVQSASLRFFAAEREGEQVSLT